jgi:hypothetical protein
MPAVIDAPEVVAHEEHNLSEEQLPSHAVHRGFWHTLGQYVRRHKVHTSHGTPSSCQGLLHPIEMPLERLARENPMLYLQVNTGL